MRIRKSKRIYILLFVFVFTLSITSLSTFNYSDFDNDTNLETSDINTLFNGKSYPFELKDVYDDENYTKIYTDAYLQTEHNQNETIFEDQVSVVNNTEHTHPEPSDITMIEGNYDNSDNMKSIDDIYSDFETDTYIPASDGDPEYIDSLDFTLGEVWVSSLPLSKTYVDDGNYVGLLRSDEIGGVWYIDVEFVFDPVVGGRDFYISCHLDTVDSYYRTLRINGVEWKIGTHIDFDDELVEGVNSISYYAEEDNRYLTGRLYYFKIVEKDATPSTDGELEFTIENDNLANYDDDGLLSLGITSYHGTNVSETITAKIWNFDTSAYETMFSTASTSVVKNYHSITSNIVNYFDGSGNLKIQYTGIRSESDFLLNIDYLEFRITYKMDISINKIFYENGLWCYRFKLIGSLHYTDWTYFEVVDPEPNFFAISESDITTRWILQDNELTPVEDFHDDINTNYWNLVDVSEDSFNAFLSESYLSDNKTGTNIWDYTGTNFYVGSQDWDQKGITWDGTYFWVVGTQKNEVYKYTSAGVYTGTHFDVGTEDTSPSDITWDGTYFWVLGVINKEVYKYNSVGVYQDVHFDVGTEDISPYGITWDGTYFWVVGATSDEVYKYNSAGVYQDVHFDVGSEESYPTYITWDGTYFWVGGQISNNVHKYTDAGVYTGVHFDVNSESSSSHGITWDGTYFWMLGGGNVFKYEIKFNISKNYFGSGYMYMQTNTTELISLKSKDYGGHKTLSSGDYFGIDFQTSSDSKIELILLKDGEINTTLTLSQSGNTNFDRHTVKISVGELVEFDQLKISSTFEDTDNVKVYDIKTYKYTIVGDHANFLVGSNRDGMPIYLTPDVYNLRIEAYSSGLNLVNENITIPATGVKQYVYTPTATKQCRIAFFNPQDIPLTFTDYHVYVNRSLGGSYSLFTLLENIFSVDVDTMVYIEIKDRFNTLIRNYEKLITPTTDYLDIELEVYSLQIKNLMTQKTEININVTHKYPLLSGDSIYFMLSEAYYQIGYYDTNNVDKQFTIFLSSNQAYELNRSRICFLSYADQQGTHLYFENYKTYLNGSLLYENMFYREIGDIVGIEIKDRYGISIKNETYTVISGDNYIPITLTMYSLKIMNQQEIFNWINITRDPNYYESSMYWSEWIAPTEIIEFTLFGGYYKINLTNNENGGSSYYSYTLNGDDILLISSGNIISNVIINLANVNTTIGNQITNVQIDLTNQNSQINNTIINIEINLSNVNSSLGNFLVNLDLGITNIANNISSLYVFTNNSFLNLDNQINNSFIYMENNIIAINQTISTLVIGLDGKITIVNATINTMWTEMSNQFIVTQSTLDFSFAFLNQTLVQIGNNITTNQVALNNLIIQRANDIDDNLIQITNLINLLNSTVANESLVVQTLVNIIGSNITENHVEINNLISLIGNNITENNLNLISLIELVGNNITTNHFIIQTLIDYVSNNITENHLELITNINFINNTIDQNQIELINRLLFINSSINQMSLDLANQIIFVNDTIYSAILNISTSIDFTSDCILGNISLTYQQNDFLTELYKETIFSPLLNWSGVAFNYSLMEDRIDVWEFINNYEDDAIIVHLKYQDLIDNLTVSAQNTIEQYLPDEDVEYRLWSIANEEYLDEWKPLPESRTVILGFFRLECRLTLLNTEGIHLEFTDYHININRSLNGVYNDSWILDSLFSVDKGTYVYISVYDRFNTSINTFEILITLPYIDLELEVYSLQIKSLLEIATILTINSTHIYPLLSGDSKYFTLLKAYYQIEYYDDNNNYKQFIIYLDSNQAYELNSTYFDVYFSIFNFDGLGLNRDLVRFYVNGERRDFGFNVLKQDTNNLKVLDFFNATIFDQNVNLGQCTEYNILVEVYTLIINNNYTHSIRIEIERDNSNIVVEQIIPAQYGMSFRFLPDIEYVITAYDLNGTKLDVKYVELVSNNKIVSFGFYSTEVPFDPEPITNTFLTYLIVIIFFVVLSLGSLKLYYSAKERKNEVPLELVNLTSKPHKKKQKGVVDNRL